MKTPCEIIMWHILPWVRRELAIIMMKEKGLSQAKVARKLGVTEAAISQYLSGKRGKTMRPPRNIAKELKTSARHILEDDGSSTIFEICRICQLVKESEMFPKFYEKHTGTKIPPCICEDDPDGK